MGQLKNEGKQATWLKNKTNERNKNKWTDERNKKKHVGQYKATRRERTKAP